MKMAGFGFLVLRVKDEKRPKCCCISYINQYKCLRLKNPNTQRPTIPLRKLLLIYDAISDKLSRLPSTSTLPESQGRAVRGDHRLSRENTGNRRAVTGPVRDSSTSRYCAARSQLVQYQGLSPTTTHGLGPDQTSGTYPPTSTSRGSRVPVLYVPTIRSFRVVLISGDNIP